MNHTRKPRLNDAPPELRAAFPYSKDIVIRCVLARFLARLRIEPSGCWVWTGMIDTGGYGRIRYPAVNGVIVSTAAHRFAYEVANKTRLAPHPECIVRHTCDTRACCNPAHLVAGTTEENNRDLIERNRLHQGEDSHYAKLTAPGALLVAYVTRNNIMTIREVAKVTGLSIEATSELKRGLTWRSVCPIEESA